MNRVLAALVGRRKRDMIEVVPNFPLSVPLDRTANRLRLFPPLSVQMASFTISCLFIFSCPNGLVVVAIYKSPFVVREVAVSPVDELRDLVEPNIGSLSDLQ
jgi:hypothetical protein